MFFNNAWHPALAYAHASDKHSEIPRKGRDLDGLCRNAADTDDFGSFSSSSSGSYRHNRPKKPQRKTVTLEIPGKTVAIAAGVIVATILAIVLLAVLLTSGTDAIKYEDNAFASYQSIDGSYRVSMNGKELRDVFDSEVDLVAAKDNSFAYVTATVNGAKNVYVLDNSRLKLICEGVDSVLALADYEIGVIYELGDRVEYYFDDSLTSLARNDDYTPKNFVISPDGTAVAYTIKNKNNTDINDLYVYTTEQSGPEARSTGQVSTVPVSISNKGEHIVAYIENGESKDLYLLSNGERIRISEIEGSFDSLVCTNADATELVFTTKLNGEYRTYVYDCTKIKKDVTSAHLISNGYAVPQLIDHTVQAPESFTKCYFQDVTSSLTIYVNKKYEAIKVAAYLGVIDPEGRYLYIINEQREDLLVQIELIGERFGKDSNKQSAIATDVTEFVITQKGNVYYTDGYGDLYYYKLAKSKPTRITNDVKELVFYTYANDLYFKKSESVEASSIYMTSEGSDHEAVEFGKTLLTDSPTFTNSYSKKTYACYYDSTTDNYLLFYTSNGNSFRLIAECEEITSDHQSAIAKLVNEVLS